MARLPQVGEMSPSRPSLTSTGDVSPSSSRSSLPQVGEMSPSRGSYRRDTNDVRLPSIPSSERSSAVEDDNEHAAFVATFGSLIGEKALSQTFLAEAARILMKFKFFQELEPGVQAALPSIMTTMSK